MDQASSDLLGETELCLLLFDLKDVYGLVGREKARLVIGDLAYCSFYLFLL